VLAFRDAEARLLAVALLGALGAEVAAALARAWPFGFTRVNAFLLPLGYLVAAVGVTRLWSLLRGPARLAAAAAGAVAYALVLSVGVRQAATVRTELSRPAYSARLDVLVDAVRARAAPTDAV